MNATRFFLDAANDGRVNLLHPRESNTLAVEGYFNPNGDDKPFRWQSGDTTTSDAVMMSFRVGDRLFHVAITSEVVE